MKKKTLKILFLFFLGIITLYIAIYLAPIIIARYNIAKEIKNEVIIELGDEISINLFLQNIENAVLETDTSLINKIGKYKIRINVDNHRFYSNLIVQDTTPPEVEVKDLKIYEDEPLPKASDFIVKIVELSDYVIDDLTLSTQEGTQEVNIMVTDSNGNRTKKTAHLIVEVDHNPPEFSGLTDLYIEVGETPDLNVNVTAIDARFGVMEYLIDDKGVNYSVPGTYKIYYSSKDNLGNSIVAERNITIKQKEITYKINNFPTYHQYPNYPNGCESIALYNLLRYYNINVTPDEIVDNLKKGSGPYRDGNQLYGGNPEIEFVGHPRDIHGYGVFQKPIIDVANQYKEGIIDYTGHSLNEVLELVKRNIPVQIWASISMKNTKVCTNWIYSPTGERINWICDLHSVVVIGYSSSKVVVSDSYTGNIETYDRQQVEKMYNLFGKRAIYYKN